MQVTTKQIQIVMPAVIGPLNELRRQKLATIAQPPFQVANINELPGAVAFVAPIPGAQELIILTEQQIDYRKEGMDVTPDLTDAIEMIGKIQNTLMLEDRSMQGVVNVVAHASGDGAATELSVEHFTPVTAQKLREQFTGLRGVGLRFTFEQMPYTCDLNIEPFYADPTVFFLRISAAWQNANIALSQAAGDAKRFETYLKTDVIEFMYSLML